MVEKDRPEDRYLGQQRQGDGLKAGGRAADIGGPEIIGKAGAEDGKGQSRYDLVALEPETDHAMNGRDQGPGQTGRQKGDEQDCRLRGRR